MPLFFFYQSKQKTQQIFTITWKGTIIASTKGKHAAVVLFRQRKHVGKISRLIPTDPNTALHKEQNWEINMLENSSVVPLIGKPKQTDVVATSISISHNRRINLSLLSGFRNGIFTLVICWLLVMLLKNKAMQENVQKNINLKVIAFTLCECQWVNSGGLMASCSLWLHAKPSDELFPTRGTKERPISQSSVEQPVCIHVCHV